MEEQEGEGWKEEREGEKEREYIKELQNLSNHTHMKKRGRKEKG